MTFNFVYVYTDLHEIKHIKQQHQQMRQKQNNNH